MTYAGAHVSIERSGSSQSAEKRCWTGTRLFMHIRLIILLTLFAVSCQAFSSAPPRPTPQLADKASASAKYWTRHDEGDFKLSIVVPEGWETYNTEAGIVLNEHVGSSAPDTPLRGFLIHIFVPYADNFRMPLTDDMNMAWYVLKQVVHNREYVGDALVSEPVAFQWDIYDAAYYLLNNRNNSVTMLLALGMPDGHNLIVCHVSVPKDQAARIRSLLPELLNTLTIDDQRVDATALTNLPDPLVFPEESD